MRNRWKTATVVVLLVAGLATVPAMRGRGSENPPMLTEPKVMVSKQGAVTASGMVDCSTDVLAMWPDYVGAPDTVLTNVSWTVNQRKGRSILTANYADAQASPCWARPGAPFVEPGRCQENADGTMHPCRWDSRMYGSDGWIFGNGAFKTGGVHLDATMEGGYYVFAGDEESRDLGSFEMRGWDLTATSATRR